MKVFKARVAFVTGGAYMTAKAAVRGFTEALRISIAPHGIGVSLLCPGSTGTRIMDEAKDKPETREMVKNFLDSAMDPVDLGVMVVEGIRNNSPYIITHAEFRDELQEIYKIIDDTILHIFKNRELTIFNIPVNRNRDISLSIIVL
jgi:short-subunit dehydrogenase